MALASDSLNSGLAIACARFVTLSFILPLTVLTTTLCTIVVVVFDPMVVFEVLVPEALDIAERDALVVSAWLALGGMLVVKFALVVALVVFAVIMKLLFSIIGKLTLRNV
jgi:hypothetical protein